MTIESGQAFVARLRRALDAAPEAKRYLIYTKADSPPAEGSPSALAGEGQGGGHPVSVVAVEVTDTCKEVVDGVVRRTVPRDSLVQARGPWIFAGGALSQALEAVVGREAEIANPLDLCRAALLRVRVLLQK